MDENLLKKIVNNFINENEVLIDSPVKNDLITMRPGYIEELRKPGCTPCMKNGLRAKYTSIIQTLLNKKQEST